MCMCAQSCPVLCNLMDCSSVHGFFQGKNTRMTCHCLLWKIFPIPGIKPTSPASPALTGRFFTTEPPGKPKAYESSLNHWTTREFPRLNVVVFFNGLSICIYKRLTLLIFFIGTDLFIYFSTFFSFISWRLITLQYCRGFCRTWT